ncbi:hypothetical protein AB0Y20_00715 [Heyndrickxia oleronia]|uniref:hypothetical protein n=1 Tax=Heyndrickxia oleronia TaxID=38875 RepID=UPI003F20F168
MKFELDESVRVKTSGKVGVVKSYRQTLAIQKNIRKETKKYLIGGNDFPFSTWLNEEGLDYIHKFDNKFEA